MKNKKRIININENNILIFMCMISFWLLYITIFHLSVLHFHSDYATSNLLAREQIIDKSLLPRDWYYANNEIMLFFINLPIIVMNFFMEDQLLMRSISLLLFASLTLLSIVFFTKKVYKNDMWLISVPIIFCGISAGYSEFVFEQGAYMPMMTILFIAVALFIGNIGEKFKLLNLKNTFLFGITVIIQIASSLRFIQLLIIPLICSVFLVYYFENLSNSDHEVLNYIKYPVIQIGIILGISILGVMLFFIIKKGVNVVSGSMGGISFVGWGNELIEHFGYIFQGFLYLIGCEPNVKLFSILGVVNGLKIIYAIFIFAILPIMAIKNYPNESIQVKVFTVFVILHVLLNIFLLLSLNGLWVNIDSSRYFISSSTLLIILSSHFMYGYLKRKNFFIKGLIILFLLCFILASGLQVIDRARDYEERKADKTAVVNYLKDNNLTHGYASYWNAGVNTVLSNFDIEINAVSGFEDSITPFYWLTSGRWYREDYYSGESFILLDNVENEEFLLNINLHSKLGQPAQVLEFDGYHIYVYDFNIAEKTWNKAFYNMYYINTDYLPDSNKYRINTNGRLHGPYISLDKGDYILTVNIKLPEGVNDEILLKITSNSGSNIIKEVKIKDGISIIPYTLDNFMNNVEFVINNDRYDYIDVINIENKKTK